MTYKQHAIIISTWTTNEREVTCKNCLRVMRGNNKKGKHI